MIIPSSCFHWNHPFEAMITHGGDERIDILENGLNRYNVNPVQTKSVLNRSSCTCSPLTPDAYRAAKKLHEKLDPNTFDLTLKKHSDTIKELLNYDGFDRFDVFFAPSGSDLCYYQLLFSRLIHPDKDIFNFITCPEEIGSGSNLALSGRYFSNRNQFGTKVPKYSKLDESLDVECLSFPARDTRGRIIDHKKELIEAIFNKTGTHAINANLVIGSKSGIENNITIISETPDNVLWTVDLCQFRASKKTINGLIGMNCCVMITGSKFYQGPPFSAALLVPKTISNKFNNYEFNTISPFGNIFSKHDIPSEFEKLRMHLPDYRNYGLLLRWEAAIAEMKPFATLNQHEVITAIDKWNTHITNRLEDSHHFSLMPDQHTTNKTIISFRARSKEGSFLNHEKLLTLYNIIGQRKYEIFGESVSFLFGQPVKYGEKSFIRLAIGSSDIRNFIHEGMDLSLDDALIDILENTIRKEF